MNDLTDDEFPAWIEDLIEGSLSQTDAQRLSARLLSDESARQVYFEVIELQADLEWLFGVSKGGIEATQRNGESCEIAWDRADWLTPALIENCRESSSDVELLHQSPPVGELRLANQASDGALDTRRHAAIRRSLAGFWRYSAVILVVSLMSVGVVVAGERIYVLVRDVLLPPRTMVADDGGGVVRSNTEERHLTGANSSGTRRIGSSSLSGVALANIFVFPLPRLDELERLHSARLEWTYKFKDLEPIFCVDLYGLGYLKSRDFIGQGFWEGAHDTSPRAAYGMEGSEGRCVTRIAAGVMTPDTPTGRIVVENHALVEYLRSLYHDGAREGDLVTFRLNADIVTERIRRSTGYAVVHPPGRQGKTVPAEFPLLSITAERGVPIESYAVAGSTLSAQSITAHWASGSATTSRLSINAGCDHNGVRRVGSSAWPNGALANVFVFTLPDITATERIEFASLEWTTRSVLGEPQFAVDLYGLGYVPGESYSGPCFWEGSHDTSLSADYGLSGSADGRVVLLARKVMKPDSQSGRVLIDNQALTDFLRSLYANGARGGDALVVRLNADSSTQHIARATGYQVVHPPAITGRTTQADLPVLRVTAR